MTEIFLWFSLSFSEKLFSKVKWRSSKDFFNPDNSSELLWSSVSSFWLVEENCCSIDLNSDWIELLMLSNSFFRTSFEEVNFCVAAPISIKRDLLRSLSCTFSSLLSLDELKMLSFKSSSIWLIFLSLSVKAFVILLWSSFFRVSFLLSRSKENLDILSSVSVFNIDIFSSVCWIFSKKLFSNEPCFVSREFLTLESSVELLWSSFSIFSSVDEYFFSMEFIFSRRVLFSSSSLSVKASLISDACTILSFTSSSTFLIFVVLSAKVCSILLARSVSKVLISIFSSEPVSLISALTVVTLSSFCWTGSDGASCERAIDFTSLDFTFFNWEFLALFSFESVFWKFSVLSFLVETFEDRSKMRCRISLILSLVSSGVVILHSAIFHYRAKNMPYKNIINNNLLACVMLKFQ